MRLRTRLSALMVFAACLAGCGSDGQPAAAPAAPQSVQQPAPVPAPTDLELAAAAAKPRYVFPVRAKNVSFHKTHAGYPATDIFAACGKPILATTSGVVLEVSRVDRYVPGKPAGPNNGGKFVSILGDDGVRYYGSHLSKVQAGIKKGVRVKAGQVIGKLGKTGNSSGVCHLHYGISPPCKKTGDWKVRRGVVWPAKYLTSWRKGGQKSPVAAVTAWKKKHNCKA
ncbi:M23 family metallopeptidase [Actinoplanes aureus]|uniref:M23 family metallopeptidase n=1 Tax=Actinoplanes aureus TaxID=2792083 RepID=A0A931FV15_9ACTN|nr:M23 family metallopeptidase [Actinoplanes aureus]MBG0560833.1 M23 family metallopeptidase [Actinoplanes aureus]